MTTDVVRKLRQSLDGAVSHGAEAEGITRDALWSATSGLAPAALVTCRKVADVQRAVLIAADFNLPVSVLGGGHDWAGRAVHPGGITLDLRRLASVAVNPADSSVTVGGGTVTGDLVANLPDDLAVVTGTWSSAGVVGVALGGGYGKLNRRFGLMVDNITRAEVVLADGSLSVAGDGGDPELLWALRGGGGNFGVVTSMTFATHLVPTLLTGSFFVPLESAKTALIAVQEMLDTADDGLSIQPILATLPSLGRGLLLGPLWIGDSAEGERRLRSIASLEGAQTLAQGWAPYKNTIDEANEGAWPKQGDYRMDAHNVPRFDEAVADILVEAARSFVSEQDAFILHDLFGAATRVPPDATAFAMREPHINVQVVAGRDDADPRGDRRSTWLRDVRTAFSPWRSRGGYPNVLGPDERESARSFCGAAVPRLERAKALYDPENRFASNIGRLR